MTIKHLVFMDIDGTLVNDAQQVSPRTQAVIAARRADTQFYVATGRMFASAQVIAADIGAAVLASNGAIFALGQQVHAQPLGVAALAGILPVLKRLDLPAYFFTDHQVFYTHTLPHYFQHSDQNRIASPDPADYVHASGQTLLAHADTIINGIIIAENAAPALAAARTQLTDLPGLTVSSSFANNLELIPAGTNKATAIAQIQAATGIGPDATFAFGDGENDLEMFSRAHYAVAMGNARPAVKARAAYTTASNVDDGIAQFLEQHLKGSTDHD